MVGNTCNTRAYDFHVCVTWINSYARMLDGNFDLPFDFP